VNAFDGVQVFCATMREQREVLGEKVTEWIQYMRRQHLGFEVVDIIVRQSSDDAFHCVSQVVTYRLGSVPKTKLRG
jgi:hypothetical protein